MKDITTNDIFKSQKAKEAYGRYMNVALSEREREDGDLYTVEVCACRCVEIVLSEQEKDDFAKVLEKALKKVQSGGAKKC